MANKKPLKLSETHACAQQFESGDTIAAAFIENGVPTGGTAGQVLAKIDGTNYNTEWVDQTGGGGGASYLVYTALLTQSGTGAPVATVLENTLGEDVTWARPEQGVYTGSISGSFDASKTWYTVQAFGMINGDYPDVVGCFFDSGAIKIVSGQNNGWDPKQDNVLFKTPVEIRVYP